MKKEMIPMLNQCLQFVDGYQMARTHKKRLRANMTEMKELLLCPATAAKVEVFARDRMEHLFAEMQCLNQRRLKAADVFLLVGSANAILKITRFMAQKEQPIGR